IEDESIDEPFRGPFVRLHTRRTLSLSDCFRPASLPCRFKSAFNRHTSNGEWIQALCESLVAIAAFQKGISTIPACAEAVHPVSTNPAPPAMCRRADETGESRRLIINRRKPPATLYPL
ncbi:MAG: hypothetical protein WCS42_11765, partial [Verrucomicrobiota bacterium]